MMIYSMRPSLIQGILGRRDVPVAGQRVKNVEDGKECSQGDRHEHGNWNHVINNLSLLLVVIGMITTILSVVIIADTKQCNTKAPTPWLQTLQKRKEMK